MRALLTGWFSFHHGEATAGDLLAGAHMSALLSGSGVGHDVAMSPAFGTGTDLESLDPCAYDRLIFVCGPAAGWQVDDLLDTYRHCWTIAVGVSVIDATINRFDAVIERDSDGSVNPDLALLARRRPLPPVVAVVRSHAQPEYPKARHDAAHAVIDTTLAAADVSVVELGTRVDPNGIGARRPEAVEAAIARADAVITTRLHGLVLALRHGVPAVAVDPIESGAKVARQAAALRWPAVLSVDGLSPAALREQLDWALTAEARAMVTFCLSQAEAEAPGFNSRIAGAVAKPW